MTKLLRYAVLAAAIGATMPALAQDAKKAGDAARPAMSTANKPSESGAQTSMPSGAATGAGQPQGGGQPAQAQSPDSAKSKAEATKGSGAVPEKKVTKKKKRKHRTAEQTTPATSGDAAQATR